MKETNTEVQIGQKWLLTAGILLVLFGIGYFLKFAFDHNWVGPWGRVAMAYTVAFLFLGVGEWSRHKKHQPFGLALMGGSIAIFYLTTYAAFQLYHLMDQTLSFALMGLVTLFAGILSLRCDAKGLAILGLVGGFFSPLLLDITGQNDLVLLTYEAVLNAGVLTLAFFKQWRILNHLGFAFTWILFLSWYAPCYNPEKFWIGIAFSSLFFLVYEIVPFAYCLSRKDSKGLSDLAITIPNTLIAFGLAYSMITGWTSQECAGFATVLEAIFFLLLARTLRAQDRQDSEAYILTLAKGIFFATLTIPILFSQNWITVLFALMACLYLVLSSRLGQTWLKVVGILLLVGSAVKMVTFDYTCTFLYDFDHFHYSGGFSHLLLDRWITLGTVLLALYAAVRALRKSESSQAFQGEVSGPLLGLFLILLFFSLNLETAAYFYEYDPHSQVAAISVLWALFATSMMGLGFWERNTAFRIVSITVFGATILKVFFFDMANVETPYRIVSFLVLGLLLIGASYLYHQFVDRLNLVPPSIPQTERK